MNSIFGISMDSIMVALLVLFGLCIGVGAWVLLRQRIIFRLGVRNVPRRPAQTVLIVIGLMLSTLIVSAALTTGDTLNHSINKMALDVLQRADELVVLSGQSNPNNVAGPQPGVTFPQQVATDLQAKVAGSNTIDGVIGVLTETVPGVNPRTKLSEPSLTAVGVDPASLAPFGGVKDVQGHAIDMAALPQNGIVLGKGAADSMDTVVGDTLTIYVNNQPHEMTVEAIASDSMLTGTSDAGQAGGFAMPLGRAQELFGKPGEISFIAVANKGTVESGVKLSDEAVAELNDALAGTSYKPVAIKQQTLKGAELAANIFTSLFVVLGLFSIAAGILLIFLIFVLLAAERKPEMGMARAVGMKRRQLVQMFIAEGIAYDLMSALVGAALGIGVAMVMAGVMGRLVGDFITISPATSWRSLVVAYTLGVVVTFITIVLSSVRVSRLNVVAAIRDIAEPNLKKGSRRGLILGVLGIAIGALLMWAGYSSDKLFPYSIGITVLPLSAALVLRRFSLPARLLYTVAAGLVLAFWLLPENLSNKIFPSLSGGMEMFFVSGIMMVATATIIIVWNADIITWLVGLLGRSFSRWQPAVKTAVAYPMASKGRTGMTIAMFSLIIFSLVMMSTINANFMDIFTGANAGGGWDIQAQQAPTNPIPNFTQALADNGVDTSKITATGRVDVMSPFQGQVRMAGTDEWKSYEVDGVDASFIDNSNLPLQIRATGYDSDKSAWDAVRDQPDLAIVDAATLPANGGFAIGPTNFHLEGVKQGDTTMQPTRIELHDPTTDATRTVTVIGVIDSKVTILSGIFVTQRTFSQVFPDPSAITYFVKTAPGVDDTAFAKEIRAGLITYGVQADSIHDLIAEGSAIGQGFMKLIEGFMALGLVVGIAALGVISFRSVVERRQQIGMLRAIGYQRSMVAASFLIESTMVTVLGVASGVILALILSRNLMTSEEFTGVAGSDAGFIIPWLSVLTFVVISLVAALVMSYIPARKASTVAIADALRYE